MKKKKKHLYQIDMTSVGGNVLLSRSYVYELKRIGKYKCKCGTHFPRTKKDTYLVPEDKLVDKYMKKCMKEIDRRLRFQECPYCLKMVKVKEIKTIEEF